MHDNIASHAVAKTAVITTQAGAAIAGLGWLSLNDALAIAGFIIALISVIFQIWVTWYFKSKHLKIAETRLKQDLEDMESEDA